VKLLFDENVSPRLAGRLAELYPGSTHVRDVGLERAADSTVWEFAAAEGFMIVSKDSDFHQRSLLFGPPPKVVWVRLGNCRTDDVERILRDRASAIRDFAADPEAAFLALS
jgi:predicted nuclease of predicted toxin-antitoxin system